MKRHDNDFDRLEIGGSRWGNIYKRKPGRDLSLEGDLLIPMTQAAALSLAAGSVVFAVLYPFMGVWSFYLIAVSMAIIWAIELNNAFGWVRGFSVHEEIYTSETIAAASSEHSSVTVHVVENSDRRDGVSVGGRMVIEQIGTDHDTLALVCQSEELSKRRLSELGINSDQSMQIVGQLIAAGFAHREAQNAPAIWTSKGNALRKALIAGGGGGGGLVLPVKTSEKGGVGE